MKPQQTTRRGRARTGHGQNRSGSRGKLATPKHVRRQGGAVSQGDILGELESMRQQLRRLVQRDEVLLKDIRHLEDYIETLLHAGASLKMENERLLQDRLHMDSRCGELERKLARVQLQYEDLAREKALLEQNLKSRLRTAAQNRHFRGDNLGAIMELNHSMNTNESLEPSTMGSMGLTGTRGEDDEEEGHYSLRGREKSSNKRRRSKSVDQSRNRSHGMELEDAAVRMAHNLSAPEIKKMNTPSLVATTTVTVGQGGTPIQAVSTLSADEGLKRRAQQITYNESAAKASSRKERHAPPTPSNTTSMWEPTLSDGGLLLHSRKSRPADLQDPCSPLMSLGHSRRSRALQKDRDQTSRNRPYFNRGDGASKFAPMPTIPGTPTVTTTTTSGVTSTDTDQGASDHFVPRRSGRIASRRSRSASPAGVDPIPSKKPILRATSADFHPLRKHQLNLKACMGVAQCNSCGQRIKFAKTLAKCDHCKSSFHPECVDDNIPCLEPNRSPKGKQIKNSLLSHCPARPPYVPSLMVASIKELEKRGLQAVGLYRVSGSEKDVKELRDKFNKNVGVPSLVRVDVHVLTSLMKNFLSSMADTLIPNSAWHIFASAIQKCEIPEREEAVIQAIKDLPDCNKHTLAEFILHLKVMEQLLNLPSEFWHEQLGPPSEVPLLTPTATPRAPNSLASTTPRALDSDRHRHLHETNGSASSPQTASRTLMLLAKPSACGPIAIPAPTVK
ncbi:unnamed protein product [Cyprideis torosa]|uniref:Uncharacterized protein n=1 Tax=Cyprideis torosa TaxID=163714 RepID=A0A7R8W7M4_9CRUS|nr:unnamed protein product [Cyprideis torosa]CAG0887686.1 unnamed protein product [Cyprideis torosa]